MSRIQTYVQNLEMINRLTEENKKLQQEMLEEELKEGKPVKTDYGTFSKVTRKSYKFSDVINTWQLPRDLQEKKSQLDTEIEIENKKLEDLKSKEIETGVAQVTEINSVRFTPVKK